MSEPAVIVGVMGAILVVLVALVIALSSLVFDKNKEIERLDDILLQRTEATKSIQESHMEALEALERIESLSRKYGKHEPPKTKHYVI